MKVLKFYRIQFQNKRNSLLIFLQTFYIFVQDIWAWKNISEKFEDVCYSNNGNDK